MQPQTQSVGRIRPVGTVTALAVAAGSTSDDIRMLARAVAAMERAVQMRTKREADAVLIEFTTQAQAHYLSQ